MSRPVASLLFLLAMTSGGRPPFAPRILSVCDLSKDYGAYRNKLIAVRGIYYYGLRQTCQQKCADGSWPSFLDLAAGEDANWDAIAEVERRVELDAKKGKHLEIWVTARGRLETTARLSPLGPCDKKGSRYWGYGHLGVFPARLVVKSFTDIEIRENPKSPYDYSNMYHGPL